MKITRELIGEVFGELCVDCLATKIVLKSDDGNDIDLLYIEENIEDDIWEVTSPIEEDKVTHPCEYISEIVRLYTYYSVELAS